MIGGRYQPADRIRQRVAFAKAARRLRKLRIDEVSTVDAAAGIGTRVVFMKRGQQGDDPMLNIAKSFQGGNLIGACETACAIAKRNEISAATFDQIFKHAATTAFPLAKSEGAAMAAFMETAVGQKMLKTHVAMPSTHEARQMKSLDPTLIKYDTDDAGDDDGGDGAEADTATHSQHLKELMAMAEKFRTTPAGAKMTKEQALVHCMTATDKGRELAVKDRQYNLQRAHRGRGI